MEGQTENKMEQGNTEQAKIDSPTVISHDKPKYMLLEKVKALYTMINPWIEQFPKSSRFTIGERIENSILDIMKALLMQNYQEDNNARRRYMLDALANMHLLAIMLQQAAVFKLIPYTHYEPSSKLVKEIITIAQARYKNLGGRNEDI